MDHLVTSEPQDRGPENALVIRIDQDLHEALRLALFDRTAHSRHWPFCDKGRLVAFADLLFGHACSPQWRVDVERIGLNAVGRAALLVVEQVGRDDFVIIVRRMREGTFAVAITERPDARYGGAQLIVDLNVTALVDSDARLVETEIVGVRAAPYRQQQVRTSHFR